LTYALGDDPSGWRLQSAELDYVNRSMATWAAFAENYVGLPLAKL
jgi:hypothetical protein